MNFYTIDSGKQGAIVHWKDSAPTAAFNIPYDESGKFIDVNPLFALEVIPFFIEKITPYAPNASTLAVQFQAYGALISMALHLSDGDMELVAVPTWQSFARKKLNYKPKSKWTKDDSRTLAISLWPEFCDKVKKRKVPDGIADALCLGAYVLDKN